MKQIQRILVVLDSDSEYLDATETMPIELQKALRLVTNKADTELYLFCVAYQQHLNQGSLSWDFDQNQRRQEYCDRLQENMAHLSAALQNAGYKCSGDVIWAHPRYEAVIAKANALQADLVVQHTRSYGKLELNHLSNDSWQMVRHCSTPLLLVKNEAWHASPRLLAAVDPTHSHDKPLVLDKCILEAAIAFEEQLSGELHVLHAYAEAARPFAPAGVIETEHREAFDALLADFSIESERLHFVDETPIAALQKTLHDLQTDILVMGAISRSRLSELLIGSTAEKVLDFLGTDVLVIKPSLSTNKSQ